MNTNPAAIKVLCYGDSNTYGTKPDRSGRFAANERWTGLLQHQLGDEYYVIEEGLGGRTTDLEHYNPDKPSRNGLVYFKACVDSHMPLDIIIVMLGTNDLKTIYHRSTKDVALALKQFPDYVEEYCADRKLERPRIILVSPAYGKSVQKSKQLAEFIKAIADQTGCEFIDAGPLTKTGADGCHLDLASHRALADKFAKIISADALNPLVS